MSQKMLEALETGKVKEIDSRLEPPEGKTSLNSKSCLYLNLPRKPVKSSADF